MPPPNDYFVNPDKPYFENGMDQYGRRHYEETEAMSPETGNILAKNFQEMVSTMHENLK
ncbi:hypothetical protein SDC9_209362 [bioreactor metagenome]|uniref:Uncharacterized protein n=1 Tax=bioreactor metagenome TaxID=1076179 RepID=A0A645JMS2_9ZZZZ